LVSAHHASQECVLTLFSTNVGQAEI